LHIKKQVLDNLPLLLEHIVSKLKCGLSEELTYHSLEHTLDVFTQAGNIAVAESVTAGQLQAAISVANQASLFFQGGH